MNDWFLHGDYGAAPTNYPTLLLALLLAVVCGHVTAWVYMLTLNRIVGCAFGIGLAKACCRIGRERKGQRQVVG